MDELIEIMSRIRPDIDFTTATALIDDDLLDSFDIIAIVGEVNYKFDVEINENDLLPENFNSASALYELIEKLQEEDLRCRLLLSYFSYSLLLSSFP